MTAIRFFNAHIIDPSQSIDGIGYLDVVNGVLTPSALARRQKPENLNR
jgi:hypothetical protein